MDREMLQMAREAKTARDRDGDVDERADAALALYEMGLYNFGGRDPREILADPASHNGRILPVATDDDAPRVRRGGEAAANQFGTFSVHTASDKQIAFIKRLLGEKDLSGIKVPDNIDTISKTGASALIDRLLNARPATEGPATPAVPAARLASDKQMAFLKRLIAERDYLSLLPADRTKVDYINGGGTPTAKGASALIDVLTATAYAPKPASTDADVEAGVYVNPDGAVYRVYLGQQSGRMLAAKVEGDEFVYAGAAARFVTSASRKMTIEEAAAWGKTTGTCIVCARRLDVPESVDRGIGPVCYARMGGEV